MHAHEHDRLAAYTANLAWRLLRIDSDVVDGLAVHESGSLAVMGCADTGAITVRVQGRVRLRFDSGRYTEYEPGAWQRYFYQYCSDAFGLRYTHTAKPLGGAA